VPKTVITSPASEGAIPDFLSSANYQIRLAVYLLSQNQNSQSAYERLNSLTGENNLFVNCMTLIFLFLNKKMKIINRHKNIFKEIKKGKLPLAMFDRKKNIPNIANNCHFIFSSEPLKNL
jgi:hypothetical protein